MIIKPIRRPQPPVLAAAALSVLALAACATGGTTPSAAETSSASEESRPEVAGTRLAISYDGGVMVVDRTSLELVDDLEADGFLRLNPAGDGRHVLVTEADGFRVLDTGVRVRSHGDHTHYYGGDPVLTDTVYAADEPGHAVVHGDRLALFADGSGEVTLVDPGKVAEGEAVGAWKAPAAHHGVAVPLEGGGMLVSVGTEEARTGAQVLDAEGGEVAASDQCPGLHGEATTGSGAVLVGCTDGALLWKDGAFTKVTAPDAYGRIGNQAGSEESEVVLGDYKVDEEAELERPERVSLVDTAAGTMRLVDLGTSYSFRSLGRGPDGEALVLGTDGALHVVDAATGRVTAKHPVVEPWKEPLDWQQPRPTLRVVGEYAYVTEPASKQLHMVDLGDGEVVETVTLPHVPDEVSGV